MKMYETLIYIFSLLFLSISSGHIHPLDFLGLNILDLAAMVLASVVVQAKFLICNDANVCVYVLVYMEIPRIYSVFQPSLLPVPCPKYNNAIQRNLSSQFVFAQRHFHFHSDQQFLHGSTKFPSLWKGQRKGKNEKELFSVPVVCRKKLFQPFLTGKSGIERERKSHDGK